MNKLPPFGKILRAYQEQKVCLDFQIYIHVGQDAQQHAFNDVRHGVLASFLPPDIDMLSYDWPILNQYVVLVDHGETILNDLHRICVHFLSFNPRLVYLWSEKHICQFFKGATQ